MSFSLYYISRRHPHFLSRNSKPYGGCPGGYLSIAKAWSVCETREVRVGTGLGWVLRFPLLHIRNPHERGEGAGHPRLAGALKHPRYSVLPWIRKFILSFHSAVLQYHHPDDPPSPEGCPMVFRHPLQECLQHAQTCIHHCSHSCPLDPWCTPNHRDRCLGLCHCRDTLHSDPRWGTPPHSQHGMRPISCWCHALIMHWTWHVFNQYPSVL